MGSHEAENLYFWINLAYRKDELIEKILTLFRLGSFGTIEAGGHIVLLPLFLLYLWSNYNQTWHDGTLGQNLSKAIKILLTSSLGGKYDAIKPILVSL